MNRYVIGYKGFVVVNAESPEEAINIADNDGEIYDEFVWGDPEEVTEYELLRRYFIGDEGGPGIESIR